MTLLVEQLQDTEIEVAHYRAFAQVSMRFKAKEHGEVVVTLDTESFLKMVPTMLEGRPAENTIRSDHRVDHLTAAVSDEPEVRKKWIERWLPRWGWMAFGGVCLSLLQLAGFPSPAHASGSGTPPEPYRTRAVQMLESGEGPGWVVVDQRRLQKVCRDRRVLWGCHVDLMGLRTIYVLDELSPRDREFTLVHEYAHELGWRH